MGKIGLIAAREFNERVRKKTFIITTILMPILFVAMIAFVMWMSTRQSDEIRNIVVVDNSGIISNKLVDEGVMKYRNSDKSFDEIRAEEQAEDIFGILVIGQDVMTNPNNVQLYTYEASTMTIEGAIATQISSIVEDEKLKAYNIDNLGQILEEVKTPVTIQTNEITADGETKNSSSVLSMIAAYIFGLLIYTFVFMYGNMVLQGVIEEKSNKVLEVMVSSVKPFELMMGKIIGIASVALTQLLLWVVFIVIVGGAAVNYFAGDMLDAAAAMNAAGGAGGAMPVANMNLDQLALFSRLADVRYILTMVISFVVYFIGGYLLYAAMFAAVGSAVDNEKDTQNLQLPITLPLMLAIFVMIRAIQDPHSQIVFWCSMIPFTSPVVMMARIPYGVPGWELILSIGLLFLTFFGMVWLAGKVYRVGIFMYGKKPTFKEMFKWIKYKY